MVEGVHSKGENGQGERSEGRQRSLLFWLGTCAIFRSQENHNVIMIRVASLSVAGNKA
jgi:hypothetical protein